ncbi:glutathione S-transferase 1-1-like [Oppia nitens]|uniref:glutathione S-transferase 1-1-like n=1 Tax=Oppia nitens TaxID=1686743 RepID=UPI0023DA2845|nr:glutathione S-transferase 1-1-like [Oppia nitens]XP_054153778.1 glutathione S-transferase 1-1-like [Oppia nitens]
MPINLYYMLESPPCRTVLMVAKQLDIQLTLHSIDLTKDEHLTQEFAQMNPCRLVPTLVDKDGDGGDGNGGNGFKLWESRAIVTYLVNKYRPNHPLYPVAVQTRATIDQFLQFDLATLYKSITDYVGPIFFGGELEEAKHIKLKETLDLFDSILGGGEGGGGGKHGFVCSGNGYDQLTVADISMAAGLTLLEPIDYSLDQWTNIMKWLANVKQELNSNDNNCYDEINAKAIENTRQYISYLKTKKIND